MNAKSNASRSGKSPQRVGGGADADLDPVGDARVGEVRGGDLGVLLGKLAGDQPSAGREPAGDADRRVAGEGAELERLAHPDRLAEEGHEGALVGGDLHPRDPAHRCGLGGDAREHLVLARSVIDDVVVKLVGELR